MLRKRRRSKRAVPLVGKRLGKSAVSKKPWRSKKHIDAVRAVGCLAALGQPPMSVARVEKLCECEGHIDPHHCRKLLSRGNTLPRDDRFVVPLCRTHHDQITFSPMGERAVWREWNIDPRDFIRSFSKEGAAALAELERTT